MTNNTQQQALPLSPLSSLTLLHETLKLVHFVTSPRLHMIAHHAVLWRSPKAALLNVSRAEILPSKFFDNMLKILYQAHISSFLLCDTQAELQAAYFNPFRREFLSKYLCTQHFMLRYNAELPRLHPLFIDVETGCEEWATNPIINHLLLGS